MNDRILIFILRESRCVPRLTDKGKTKENLSRRQEPPSFCLGVILSLLIVGM